MNDGWHATSTQRHPETWLGQVQEQGHGMVENDLLSADEVGDEALLMGLRLREGMDLSRYYSEAGKPIDPERLAGLIDLGLVEQLDGQRIRATPKGWLVLDAVIADLAA
jgi:oxygen-independent coproporphyrinogen-3 oxidase